jgi:hypothetical protein
MKPPKAEAPRLQAVGDLNLWELKVGRHGRDGPKTYTYWMASWREDGKVRNVYLGSTRRMTPEQAMAKARAMKAEALGLSLTRKIVFKT